MKANLASIHAEIVQHAESRGLVVFYAQSPESTQPTAVYWDTLRHSDYREYIAAAEGAGAKVLTVYAMEFDGDRAAEALEQLELTKIPREERREIERTLKGAGAYEGFVCEIELSFDCGSRVYVFDLRTDWYTEIEDIFDRIDESFEDGGEDEEPLGGYFSRN
jgi:hypothetical protein